MRGAALLAIAILADCGGQPSTGASRHPLVVRIEPIGDSARLVLTAAPGWKINARVKPALETSEGRVFRFDAARLTPDSAYFADPPTATVPGRPIAVRGTLRASVCAAGEQVCRVVTMAVRSEK